MRPFSYVAAQSADQAIGLLGQHGRDAKILAGGTDLLIEWRRSGAESPRCVIDIARLTELFGIKSVKQTIEIGPLTTHAELASSSLLDESVAFLRQAASMVGSPQIRNKGTVGGNIMNAAACADTLPPLVALGATATLRSMSGAREISLDSFFVKPYVTRAQPDELLTKISFVRPPSGTRTAFIKLGRRNALAISRLSVASMVRCDVRGQVVEARIVPGAAFPTWKRMTDAEKMLIGNVLTVELATAAGQKVSDILLAEVGRRWSTEYKLPVLGTLVRRALEACMG